MFQLCEWHGTKKKPACFLACWSWILLKFSGWMDPSYTATAWFALRLMLSHRRLHLSKSRNITSVRTCTAWLSVVHCNCCWQDTKCSSMSFKNSILESLWLISHLFIFFENTPWLNKAGNTCAMAHVFSKINHILISLRIYTSLISTYDENMPSN
ncbi:hypothetical protein EBX93_01455 [bacterium]|nr:hypothetical protein [bacterium]